MYNKLIIYNLQYIIWCLSDLQSSPAWSASQHGACGGTIANAFGCTCLGGIVAWCHAVRKTLCIILNVSGLSKPTCVRRSVDLVTVYTVLTALQILQLFHWDFGHLDSDTKVVRLEHKASKAVAKTCLRLSGFRMMPLLENVSKLLA